MAGSRRCGGLGRPAGERGGCEERAQSRALLGLAATSQPASLFSSLWPIGGEAMRAWGPGRSADTELWPWGRGRPSQAGPRSVKEKNIPRPANCCSQLFFTPLAWERKKKQRFLWRRMQKGCRILTISCTRGFPSGVWAPAWHRGVTGRDWPERLRPLSGIHWRARPSRHHHPEAGPEAGV